MKILVINSGSSTVKFQLIGLVWNGAKPAQDERLARGLVDRVGGSAVCSFSSTAGVSVREEIPVPTHEDAVRKILNWLHSLPQQNAGGNLAFDAIGHRVVHGGEHFVSPVLLDDKIIAKLEDLNDLAPLHNPAAIHGIRAARKLLGPAIPSVAAFDTSFHHAMHASAATYAIPAELALKHRIRRYGFHGLAHQYSLMRYAELTGTPEEKARIITLHLGNGCSACAIRDGASFDTSMGFTPLEGLMMGTRSGDLDPSIVSYLARREGVTADEVESWLNKRSGLLGVSGLSNDMRELTAAYDGNPRARLAVDMFCYRARKYIGAYLAALGGAQAVVFSGGIGENNPLVRAIICTGMEWCGLELDAAANASVVGQEGMIAAAGSALKVLVVRTDEEIIIARETARLIAPAGDKPADLL
jgi:acetate kinase